MKGYFVPRRKTLLCILFTLFDRVGSYKKQA